LPVLQAVEGDLEVEIEEDHIDCDCVRHVQKQKPEHRLYI